MTHCWVIDRAAPPKQDPHSVMTALLLLVSSASAEVVKLGILHRLTAVNVVWNDFVAERSNTALGTFWEGVSCAAELALQHAQQKNGTVVRELGLINATFEGYAFDTQSDAFGGINGYRSATVMQQESTGG